MILFSLFDSTLIESNLFVIGNGIDLKRFDEGYNLSIDKLVNKKFILSVSQIYRLKNFDNLIRSYLKILKTEDKDLNLVIVGTIQDKIYFNELKKISSVSKKILFLQNISDSELNWLYKNCEIYILLSFFEGFSLTPAEAICSGKSVILSDIEVHRNIYDGLAKFVDPRSLDSISEAILDRKNNKISKEKREDFKKKISLKNFMVRLYQLISL